MSITAQTVESDKLFDLSYTLDSPLITGTATIEIRLCENPTGEKLSFRFGAMSYVDEQKDPRIINIHRLLDDCDRHTPYNGMYMSDNGKTLTVFYAIKKSGDYHLDNEYRDMLALAMDRLRERLADICNKRNSLYRQETHTQRILLRDC